VEDGADGVREGSSTPLLLMARRGGVDTVIESQRGVQGDTLASLLFALTMQSV
jgi:hypothetical protein